MPPVQPGDSPECDLEDLPSANNAHQVTITDSDSEEEHESHEGYELLSQDPENCLNECDDEDNDSNFLDQDHIGLDHNTFDIHNLLLPSPNEITCDGKQSREDTHMDHEHIEKIKDLMKNIQLPSSNLPQWANAVPEEEWKAQLFVQMKERKLSEKNCLTVCSSSCER